MEGIGGKFGQAGLLDIIALPYLIGRMVLGGAAETPTKSLAPSDGGAQPPAPQMQALYQAMMAQPQQAPTSQPMISNQRGGPTSIGRTSPQTRPPTPQGMQPFISQGPSGQLQLGNYTPQQIDAAQRLRTLLMMSGMQGQPRR